jgi:hypothetical protein
MTEVKDSLISQKTAKTPPAAGWFGEATGTLPACHSPRPASDIFTQLLIKQSCCLKNQAPH